jgi:copper chaperone CopZ
MIANVDTEDAISLRTDQFGIEGANTERTIHKIEKAFRKAPGVKDVSIDREHHVALVTYDTAKTNIPDLHDILLKSGYKPTRIAE